MDDHDEVQRLLQRARANRSKLNERLTSVGESPHPVRSPLRERSNDADVTKFTATEKVTQRYTSPAKSPSRAAVGLSSTSASTPITRARSPTRAADLPSEKKKETFNREVTEKKTTIESSPVREGNRETFSKTTITEKEEKIHKEEYIRFSSMDEYDEEVFGPSGRRMRFAALAKKFHSCDDEDDDALGQARSRSPLKSAPQSPSRASGYSSPLKSAPQSPSRASRYNSPFKDADVTREIDVDEELAGIEEEKEQRLKHQAASPRPFTVTKDMAKDPAFLKSLKAQGYEESSSKSKLVYDFNKPQQQQQQQREEVSGRQAILSSPTRSVMAPRPSSPYKPHPLQFVSPHVAAAVAAAEKTNSPVQMAKRPVSPTKAQASPARVSQPALPVSRPPKPVRTWAAVETESTSESEAEKKAPTWRTEATLHLNATPKSRPQPPPPAPPSPPKPVQANQQQRNELTDTASRRSMVEKRSMFEQQTTTSPSPAKVDPAMLSMSERRALFEKNRTVPKPIARFGESVTPLMLSRSRARTSPEQKVRFGSQVKPRLNFSPERTPVVKMPVSPERPAVSPQRRSPSPKRESPKPRAPSPVRQPSPEREPSPDRQYPGVNSLKRIKVSPPKPGGLYPQLIESSDSDDIHARPGTSMSTVSMAPSEAPSLGAAIKRAASVHRQLYEKQRPMPSISENTSLSQEGEEEDISSSDLGGDIDDMLDEALEEDDAFPMEGPTPSKSARLHFGSPTASAASWEFQSSGGARERQHHDFKTPLVEQIGQSPQPEFPEVEGTDKLFHTVSFYRKQKTPMQLKNVVRQPEPIAFNIEEKDNNRENIQMQIRKLVEEAEEQKQRMEQASKALNFCISQDEFEGSAERVEGERLLLEATHIYTAVTSEIKRLQTEGAIGKSTPQKNKVTGGSRGSISISGLALPLKADFIRMLQAGGDDTAHYFVVLVKCRGRVIATQMLSTLDGINNRRLVFPNLINLRDLEFDFEINLEVYGLQTRKEHLEHDIKYRIRKEKSMFNLTPLKKMKKQDSRVPSRNQNPVNSKTIRRPAFGMVGFATINMVTLKNRSFRLEKVPEFSPLDGALEMTLTITSESKIEQRGFLTLFTDVNGYGDWCRRWCLLSGNAVHCWKYPEDEGKMEPTEQILLSNCITEEVALAPRDICSRINTFMLETRRQARAGDRDSLIMSLNRNGGFTTIRHLLSADTREERMGWCGVLNSALENIRAWDPMAVRPRVNSQSSIESEESGRSGTTATSNSTDIW